MLFLKHATGRTVYSWLRTLWSASKGQDLIEYALIAALCALAAATLLPGASDQIATVMSKVQSVVVSSGNESNGNH